MFFRLLPVMALTIITVFCSSANAWPGPGLGPGWPEPLWMLNN